MRTVLTIAGSDSSGGAGIQADLKTMEAYGCYGMSVITAVTAQNTLGVTDVEELSPGIVEKQLAAVLLDIRPDAVKIGMVYTGENIKLISGALEKWEHGPVVLDPVLLSTSGRALLKPEAAEVLERLLFPQADLLTPNLPEAAHLLEKSKETEGLLPKGELLSQAEDGQLEEGALALSEKYHTAVLLKGGHRAKRADDLLCADGKILWFSGDRLMDGKGSHGTGCTLSSAIACGLALGNPLPDAVANAKAYVAGALQMAPGLGHGNGPLLHGWRQQEMK